MNSKLQQIINRQSLKTQARIRAALQKWGQKSLNKSTVEDLTEDSAIWGRKVVKGGGYAKAHCRGRALAAASVDVGRYDVENHSLKAILAAAGSPQCTCCGARVNTRKSDKKKPADYELGHAFVPQAAMHVESPLLEYSGWSMYNAKHLVGSKGVKAACSYNVQVQCASCNAAQGENSALTFLDRKGGRGRPSPFTKNGSIIDRDTFVVESVLRWILQARIDNKTATEIYNAR